MRHEVEKFSTDQLAVQSHAGQQRRPWASQRWVDNNVPDVVATNE
jgi:hypothetical protein